MTATRTYTALSTLVAAAALALSACGGDGDSTDQASAAPEPGTTETVSITSVDGVGDVLVDADGAALYTSDPEADGDVLCVDGCAAIWVPLTLPANAASPSGEDELDDRLGIVMRPDGAEQVAFDGKPLYSFVEDPEPGTVTGDGFTDTFEGTEFVWHVATASGAAGGSPSSDGTFDY